MQQGQEVFWPAAPQSAVDLVVDTDGIYEAVQVKTARVKVYRSGSVYLYAEIRDHRTKQTFDVAWNKLAIVYQDHIWLIDAPTITAPDFIVWGTHKGNNPRWAEFKVAGSSSLDHLHERAVQS